MLSKISFPLTDKSRLGNTIFRRKVLVDFCVDNLRMEELLEYNKSISDFSMVSGKQNFPLEDESFISYWEKYIKDVHSTGPFMVLRKYLPELNFPIIAGISGQEKYLDAVRRGIIHDERESDVGFVLEVPDGIKVYLYRTYAGKIPVISIYNRKDFCSIVSALAGRNEPLKIPDSVGAYTISGYNNWDRIRHLQLDCIRKNGEEMWPVEFQRIKEDKTLYKDCFIIMCAGFYSGISNEQIGLTEKEWLEKSEKIRLNHECTHYVFKRLFSFIGDRIIHELIADFMGIIETTGKYKAKWGQLFLGIESYPDIRESGRLRYYGEKLDDKSFSILASLTYKATLNLEKLNGILISGKGKKLHFILLMTLSQFSLEEIVSEDFISLFEECFKALKP